MRDNIWGVLVGGALGDAMGMPTECCTQETIRQNFPDGVTKLYPSNDQDVFARRLEAGSITDDTINTLMILDMIINNKGVVKVQEYVDKLRDWNTNSGVSAYVSGPSTLKALEKIENGVPIEETGISGTTNGAAMKIGPIGLVSNYMKMDELVRNVHQICMPTHNTKIAIAGASAVAAAISYVIHGGSSIEEIWNLAYKAIEASAPYGYDFPSASLAYRMKQTQNIIAEEKDEKVILKRLYQEIGSGMESIETIPCVFAIVELADKNPLKAAQLSAEIGWDTDTIGAISCSICGGMNPEFPEDYIQLIEKVNGLDFHKFTEDIYPYVK
ncbi:ADP-ribosylglycohydrolase family protein [Amedibacillus sp. YH-ame6]